MTRSEPDVRAEQEALFSTAAEHYARHRPRLPAVLFEALPAGYGRPLTATEEARLVIDAALDAVSGIAYGVAHNDPELTERGRRTLARLRAERRAPLSPTEDAT